MKALSSGLGLSFDERLENHALLTQTTSEAERLLSVYEWKSGAGSGVPIIASLAGGTGTGKSTLFNSLVEAPLSRVEARRPTTLRPLIYLHEDAVEAFLRCPLLDAPSAANASAPDSDSGMVVHKLADFAGLILVDAPDFDSVEPENLRIADDFFIISDVVIFVTSQEKYADMAGRRVRGKALEWGKKALFVMNKVVSDAAFLDFKAALEEEGVNGNGLIRIERLKPAPLLIPGLRNHPGFTDLFAASFGRQGEQGVRGHEVAALKRITAARLTELERLAAAEIERVESINIEIGLILGEVSDEMELRLDAVLPSNVEGRVQDRLKNLLRKYDIFFTPRLMVRNALKKTFGTVSGLLWSSESGSHTSEPDGDIRSEDLQETRASVNLAPLEAATARLNLEISRLLSSDKAIEDLRNIARDGVPRWDSLQLRSMFDDEFPGVEELLEAEFVKFKDGLSGLDEFWLYSSYTVSALMIVTAEIVMGGGFTLLDALLGGVIVPFIPKWLLNLKIVDLLREMGERVDHEYRNILRGILEEQAELYIKEYRGLLPGDDAMNNLTKLTDELRA